MDVDLNSEDIEVECPECNAPIKVTVGEARRDPTRRCPNGHQVSFEASSLDRAVRQAEKAMKDFEAQLKRSFGS